MPVEHWAPVTAARGADRHPLVDAYRWLLGLLQLAQREGGVGQVVLRTSLSDVRGAHEGDRRPLQCVRIRIHRSAVTI